MKSDRRLKDSNREKRIYAFRTIVASIFVLSLTGGLIFRMYYLQITNHTHFQTLSDKNRMQLQSIAPNRGLIYDRNGILLADNRPIFSVAITPEDSASIDESIASIAQVISISDDHVRRFKKRLKRARRPFHPVILKSKLTEKEIAMLEVRRHELKGVKVLAELARHYPMAKDTAHSIGYVGRINEKELKKVDEQNYSATNYIGKLGVEKFYESELHGQVGFQTVETNASNRVLRVLDRSDPVPGRNLTLHMDAQLQNRAVELLGSNRGAVVAIEPETGGILAMVSTPSFDPNAFVTGIDYKSYGELRDSLDLPLFNRALKGQYPPGSTIKPMVGLGGLDTNTTTREFSIWDEGRYQLQNDERIYRDWKREGHGRINLRSAIAQSCDTYFYDLAFKMGVDQMSKYLGYFGFGSNTALDISEARSGILPTREWKKALKGRSWYPGDSLNLGIGQGFMLATPLQLATATAFLANRGRWVAPTLLRSISLRKGESEYSARRREVEMPDLDLSRPEDLDYIIESMADVMHGRHGTARGSGRNASYKMAGKTGTAQVVGIAQGEKYDAEALIERHRDHALFVGFAPLDEPQIAVAVIVENGGGGSSAAAPVARAMFDEWLISLGHIASSNPDTPKE
ncbi:MULTISPECIES: penicillin-binding protein 2 [unclassified Oleiphilus]|uniref:penicillin-binding protein 2 n=1 Tax=unclassified Oleiphilus TaxID=2631174 RepID=UPI0007C24876|nr:MULTISPECIES: penicillin-binding protein 2 [unclassified Oleiphilus]KZY46312.1 penicillin-binding protein 2 [Oleiphilus sp. HI0050]KZY87208.1 penicillin-binding protein 2 [Oleiphilus sp. HI0072]KZZ10119.1 penicillin-binding protein 2 [Oleiphilus sp. HI0078]KZY33985.1 penicillin-binding protein 2 [Oleiphilus sp. HI0043]KZY59286.1 penicillin-binding protein 2 [Oleiphilus sp. HI0061]